MPTRRVGKLRANWKELIDYAALFAGSLAEQVLELEAHCRKRERETKAAHPHIACDELGAGHLSFSFLTEGLDAKGDGLELFRRLGSLDRRVSEITCIASGVGFARFRVSYRSA